MGLNPRRAGKKEREREKRKKKSDYEGGRSGDDRVPPPGRAPRSAGPALQAGR